MKLLPVTNKKEELIGYMFDCPGCNFNHVFHLDRWNFDGNMENPTFTPSLVVQVDPVDGSPQRVCHLFVTNGVIKFLDDCTHKLKGAEVELPDMEE